MNRRHFLQTTAAASATLFTGCDHKPMTIPQAPGQLAPALPFYDAVPPLVPIRAHGDRLFKITVCIRPFRAVGPRIEFERVGSHSVIHNYGHGGSGWSLSWGSGARVVALAQQLQAELPTQTAPPEVAVIGCGALGLTAATMLQRAGFKVTIFAKDRVSDSRSFRATGSWTPDSRIALAKSAPTAFAHQWEQMARTSWHQYQAYLGLAGSPIEFTDRYILSDATPEQALQQRREEDPLGFAHYMPLIQDINPRSLDLPPGQHPFPTRFARRNTQLMFNITGLSHQIFEDFMVAGGQITTREFHTAADLATIPQRIVVNCTGFGAAALFGDTSLTPVRGQIGWLIPQPEANYGIVVNNLNVLSRRDGIVVQLSEQGEASGWNSTNETPDRREAEEGVRQLRALQDRMHPTSRT